MMLNALVSTIAHYLQCIININQEGATYGWNMNPATVVSSHIESANIVLKEDSKVCHIRVTTYSHYELGIRTYVIVVKVNPL